MLGEESKLDIIKLVNWLAQRQSEIGINGRTGKIPDSCYCFWVTATSKILGHIDVINEKSAIDFILNCQNCEIVVFI